MLSYPNHFQIKWVELHKSYPLIEAVKLEVLLIIWNK